MKSDSHDSTTVQNSRCLLDLRDGESGCIHLNRDRKSAEMGLFAGAQVTMFRNRKSEQSVVIGSGDARFLVSRQIAGKIDLM